MPRIPYDASRTSLYHPGNADDFFQLGDYSSDAALCAEMARLAYVREIPRLTQYLARAHFQPVEALGYDAGGTQAFIATKLSEPLTVVSFRGTELEDIKDALADAEFLLTDWHDAGGRPIGQVHGGFARYARDRDIFSRVKAHLDRLPLDRPALDRMQQGHRVLVTGHSLGAALATLMASWMPNAELYTFGSPRVGTPDFVQAVRNRVAARFVDCCDIVTRLPPKAVLNYADAGTLTYIDRNGERHAAPSASAIRSDRLMARLGYWRHLFVPGNVLDRSFADHAPINYVSGVMGLRG